MTSFHRNPIERILRIAVVAPVAQSVPPRKSGSIETVTSLLVDSLVEQGQTVTLFAAGSSTTSAKLHATFELGYHNDLSLWPWELCEQFNLAAAVERAADFDLIHAHAEFAPISLAYSRLSPVPIVHTIHHWPTPSEISLWRRYQESPFIAISKAQAQQMKGLNIAGIVSHVVDTSILDFQEEPGSYLLFIGRFTEGKGVIEAIDLARRSGIPLLLAAAENKYYRETVSEHVDGKHVIFVGEVAPEAKAHLLGGARAILYPVQVPEPFGLVLAEAMACGTPVAALNRGAVSELVEHGITGGVFDTVEQLSSALSWIVTLDRKRIRERAVTRFSPHRMALSHIRIYDALVNHSGRNDHASSRNPL